MHVLSYFTELRPCETFISIKHRIARAHGVHTLSSLQRRRCNLLHLAALARCLILTTESHPPTPGFCRDRKRSVSVASTWRALGFEGGFIQQFSLLVRVHGLGFDDSASSNGRAVYYCPDVTARALVSLPCLRARPIVPVGVTASSYPTSGSYDVAVGAHGFPGSIYFL